MGSNRSQPERSADHGRYHRLWGKTCAGSGICQTLNSEQDDDYHRERTKYGLSMSRWEYSPVKLLTET